jgi:diphthamide biosynthesis protein 3
LVTRHFCCCWVEYTVDMSSDDKKVPLVENEADLNVEGDLNSVYEEVELSEMEWDEDEEAYFYPCPCGDRFIMPLEDLELGEEIALCPSCSLRIRVLYDPDDFQ